MNPHQQRDEYGAEAVWYGRENVRADFIRNTYLHLVAAIFAFIGIEVFLFKSGLATSIIEAIGGLNALAGAGWLWVLGGFLVVGWLANHFAAAARSLSVQYLGLGLYVVAEALIFAPLLMIAQRFAPGAIESAAVVTLIGFAGLTAVAFVSRKDFSFLGSILKWGFLCALLVIIGGAVFGFNLGMFFSVAMVALAGGAILYDTSNVLHHYPQDRYVAASLSLFSSVALMFWYVLRLFMSRD